MSIETILGIDYGLKRVGVAVGNNMTRNAEPLRIIQRSDDAQVIDMISRIAREWQVKTLVVGVPRHPDGAAHEMTTTCLQFIEQLRTSLNITVIEVDERYSSVATPLKIKYKNGKIRAAEQDDQAAAVILKQYLTSMYS